MSINITDFKEVPNDQLRATYAIGSETYMRRGHFLEFEPWKERHSSLYDGRYGRHLVRHYGSDEELNGYSIITNEVRIKGHGWTKIIEAAASGKNERSKVLSFSSMVKELPQSGFAELGFIEVRFGLENLCVWLQRNADLDFFKSNGVLNLLIEAFLSQHEVQIIPAERGLSLKRDSMGRQDYSVYPMSNYLNSH